MESKDIAHGPLEFVFTIDEETGLTGAAEFPGGLLKSKYFLNLDNEEIGTLCIGCSGGHQDDGAAQGWASSGGARIGLAHQGLWAEGWALGRRYSSRARQCGAHPGWSSSELA